jgi:DNA-binding LacI/PurR family transcriptional regulator
MIPEAAGGETREERSETIRRLFGRSGEHQKTVTMASIARATGVSQGAISSLLNDRDYGIRVSQSTRDRVFRICRELGYVPNDLRAIVRMYPEVGDVCVLLPPVDSSREKARSFDFHVVEAVRRFLSERALSFVVADYQLKFDYQKSLDSLPHPIWVGTTSKVLIVGPGNASLVRALVERQIAVVTLGSSAQVENVGALLPDFYTAGKTAIDYLKSLGHEKIAVVSGPFGSGDPGLEALNKGVSAGYRDAGVSPDDQNVIYGEQTVGNGANALDVLWERERPTAIFCSDDSTAAGVLSRAREKGIAVPDALSVIGLGDEPMAAVLCPALTTFRVPFELMAKRAIEELVHRIAETNPKSDPVLIPVSMVERQSAGRRKKSFPKRS